MKKHIPEIRRFLYSLFNGNREDMEDAEQEILLALFQTLPRFRGDSSFKTYLYRLCRNKAIDSLRKKGRERRILRLIPRSTAVDETNPEDEAVRRSERGEILRQFRRLNREERILLTLKDVEGVSIREVSCIMAVPEGTIKSRLHRTREKLAGLIRGEEKCPVSV